MSKIYFISGVCGVGKSTIIPHLKKMFPKNEHQVFDFDERGLPVDDIIDEVEVESIARNIFGKVNE